MRVKPALNSTLVCTVLFPVAPLPQATTQGVVCLTVLDRFLPGACWAGEGEGVGVGCSKVRIGRARSRHCFRFPTVTFQFERGVKVRGRASVALGQSAPDSTSIFLNDAQNRILRLIGQ